MAIRAAEQLQYTEIRPFTVAVAPVIAGQAVKHSGADLSVTALAAVGDEAVGIVMEDAAVGAICKVAMFGNGIKKVKVGTGGATRGKAAKFVANGLTNATIGGATTALFSCGQFLESGVVGDMVAVNLGLAGFTVGS
jgi:hypothetical protein